MINISLGNWTYETRYNSLEELLIPYSFIILAIWTMIWICMCGINNRDKILTKKARIRYLEQKVKEYETLFSTISDLASDIQVSVKDVKAAAE